MAGRPHRTAATRAHRPGSPADPAVELEPTEVPAAARVQRSRLALAVAVTLAAVPILVLDNFPATAATNDRVQVAATDEPSTERPTTTEAPSTTAALETSTTAAPTTSTTAAPTTTVAPAPTTTAAPVRRVAAARPTTTAPPTTQAPPPTYGYGDPNDPASWDRMAQCEAGGNWAANTGNGYYGGLQFSLSTWQSYGGTGYPHQASKATQIEIGKRLQAAKGWGAWPGCARELGYT
jgi:hypothetical protein